MKKQLQKIFNETGVGSSNTIWKYYTHFQRTVYPSDFKMKLLPSQ